MADERSRLEQFEDFLGNFLAAIQKGFDEQDKHFQSLMPTIEQFIREKNNG